MKLKNRWMPIRTAPKDDTPVDIWVIHPSTSDKKGYALRNYQRVAHNGNEKNVYYDPIKDGECVVRDAVYWKLIDSDSPY